MSVRICRGKNKSVSVEIDDSVTVSEILCEIEPDECVSYFGAEKLLAEMSRNDIMDFVQENGWIPESERDET